MSTVSVIWLKEGSWRLTFKQRDDHHHHGRRRRHRGTAEGFDSDSDLQIRPLTTTETTLNLSGDVSPVTQSVRPSSEAVFTCGRSSRSRLNLLREWARRTRRGRGWRWKQEEKSSLSMLMGKGNTQHFLSRDVPIHFRKEYQLSFRNFSPSFTPFMAVLKRVTCMHSNFIPTNH